jgi:hypothetical protein
MQKLIVARNVCDLYADASQSERVSQAILGQTVLVAAQTAEHCHVVTPDLYRGHARRHALAPASDHAAGAELKCVTALFAAVRAGPSKRSELLTTLVMSTLIPVLGKRKGYACVVLPDGTIGYVRKSQLSAPPPKRRAKLGRRTISGITAQAVSYSVKLVGTPYLWGGSTPYGIDCSGFVQLCYRLAGFHLPRDAYMQFADQRFTPVEVGSPFSSASLKAGDLVFFGNAAADGGNARVTHVGMILPDGRMIHSAGGYGVAIESRADHRLGGTYLGARRLRLDAPAKLSTEIFTPANPSG